MRRTCTGLLALVGLLVAGCQAEPASPVAVSASPEGAAKTKTSPPVAELSTDVARKARADELIVLATLTGRSKGHRRGVLALSRRGQALMGVDPPPARGELIAQSRLQLVRGGKDSWLPETPTEARPRQAFDGTMPDDSTAAWMETRSTDLFDVDWKVFGWSRGKVRLLADSDTFAKGHPLPPAAGAEHLMASDGKSVWWSYRKAGTDLPIATDIATVGLTTKSPPRLLIEGADLPTADPHGGLLYVRDPNAAPGSVGYALHLLRGADDEILYSGQLDDDEFVSALCAGPDAVAWAVTAPSDDPGGQIWVMNRTTKDVQVIQRRDSGRGAQLACGDDFVAWGNGSGNGDAGQYLWSLKTGSLVKLGESFGISGVVAAGRYVAWTLPPTSAEEPADTRLARWDGG